MKNLWKKKKKTNITEVCTEEKRVLERRNKILRKQKRIDF